MAESIFLKYQDKNKDGLIDACDDFVQTIPTFKCPPCTRNPAAVTPNWRKKDNLEPWLNEKYCLMQCTITTRETSLLPPPIGEFSDLTVEEYRLVLFDTYANDAMVSLLDNFNKLVSQENIQILLDAVDYSKYDLDPRPFSNVKLLYSVPVDVFALIPDMTEDDQEEESTDTSPIVVKYNTNTIFPKLMKLRKAMNLYGRYYRVFTGIEGGNLYFDDGTVFTHNKFDRYGDAGFFVGSSRTADVLKDLDNFLNDRGYNLYLAGIGDFKYLFDNNNVTKFEMSFSHDYKLNKLTIYTVGCGEKPIVFSGSRLNSLNSKTAYKDPTALAYFAKLDEIDSFLSARVERPWLEFVEKFTYPKVSTAEKYPTPQLDGSNTKHALSCVGDALLEEGKQLGQDIIDDIFSIGDAIAYQFHKNVCKRSQGAINTELEQLGIIHKTTKNGKRRVKFNELKDPKTGETKSIAAMATSQAFEQLEDSDQVFIQMCATLLGSSLPLGTSTDEIMRTLYRDGLGRLKLCGLLDLMMDAIQCLFKGLSLEQALKVALQSALKALPLNNWGDLFIGLPANKQRELDALVKKKMSEPPAPSDRRLDDVERADDNLRLFGKIEIKKPWEDEKLLEREQANKSYGNYDNEVRQISLSDPYAQRNNRTLIQKLDDARSSQSNTENFGINPDSVMDAYIIALIEVYSNDLLSLVDELNKYPGAEIIAKIIAIFDCPAPPTFDPNFADFLNSVDLPFCRNIQEIQLPMLQNPFGWVPSLADILNEIYNAIIIAIQQVLLKILFRILIKVCELLGDAICKALGTVGDVVASLPDLLSGRDTFGNIIRESICGPDASDEQVDATIAEMFEKFGVGGAALSDREKIRQFCEDLANSTSRREMFEAADGNASQAFNDTAMNILVNQYPEFLDAFPTKQDIADLFSNIGKLMPAPVRDSMRDFLNNIPENDLFPANPSLCATPEDLDRWLDRRCLLLEGKCTPEDCETMFDQLQSDLLEDLEELTDLSQSGIGAAVAAALPPIVSTPGCDDGIVPFENEIDSKLTNNLIGGQLEQLQIAYSKDMLGNGGLFAGNDDWGLINMILSDTHGRALSTHRRLSANKERYVDYATKGYSSGLGSLFSLSADQNYDGVDIERQFGQFPAYVGEHLRSQILSQAENISFDSDNSESNIRKGKKLFRSFEDLGFEGLFGTLNINLLALPDFGYNTKFSVQMNNERVVIKKAPRKDKADIKLSYQDNRNGKSAPPGVTPPPYDFGFEVKMWLSDIEMLDTDSDEKIYINRPDDNARVAIIHKAFDPPSEVQSSTYVANAQAVSENDAIRERKYEFLSVDNTLDNINLENYPSFALSRTQKTKFIPQVNMLADLLGKSPTSQLKEYHDSFLNEIMKQMMTLVAGNLDDVKWSYGAGIDDITEEDMIYVVKGGTTLSDAGTAYGKARVPDFNADGDREGDRKISNDDMILGISYMKYKQNNKSDFGTDYDRPNRVFYLDPMVYGGSYARPKVYVKPVKNTGWLGMVDVMFPEIGPCKPQLSDLVDFGEIQTNVQKSLANMPEDQRLKGDPDCVVEKPYDRILNRQSKATIQGLITAACRIYASVYYVKCMPTFVTFNAGVKENYSSIFAAYIVEVMEKDFKDAQGGFAEFFNPFKDEEFWYSFLEQSVQTYSRLVAEGKIDPPEAVQLAMFRLNDAQENYKYPSRSNLKTNRELDRAQEFPFQTLKGWRYERNLEAVQSTEEDAKLVLKEFIVQELNAMATKFNDNCSSVGLSPQYNDLLLYTLKFHSQGGANLDLDKEIKEEVMEIGTSSGGSKYTDGTELALPDGTPYVGYYHIHENEDGINIYMVGEHHNDESHEELTVFANKIIVPIGDIDPFGTSIVSNRTKPFVIQKYISINGNKMSPNDAIAIVKEHDDSKNISDVYPGTLKLERDEDDRIIGLSGKLGVRYGLQLSFINHDGEVIEVTNAELDALDLKCTQIPPLEANSKLLLCLVNMLKDDEKFKILMSYVFPLSKLTSLIAIYNDQGMLSSIGQITASKGDKDGNYDKKPGMKININEETGQYIEIQKAEGWEHYSDRNSFPASFTPFYRTWDEWDKVLLRNSRTRIKKLFKPLYNNRDFDSAVGELTKPGNGGKLFIQNLKAAISLPPGGGLGGGRRLKSTPFNAKGKLCNKNDD